MKREEEQEKNKKIYKDYLKGMQWFVGYQIKNKLDAFFERIGGFCLDLQNGTAVMQITFNEGKPELQLIKNLVILNEEGACNE